MFQIFQLFYSYVAVSVFMLLVYVLNILSASDICCKRFYLDVAHVSHKCCNSMLEMIQLFQSYVAISVFMLQVERIKMPKRGGELG